MTDKIIECANKAIVYYKQRSQILKGPSGSLHSKTVHLINYHLSELLSEATLKLEDRQKHRKQISESLISAEWIPEGIHLIEKSK